VCLSKFIKMEIYKASDNRYDGLMKYVYCGNSGLLLPRISLGLWHNFGFSDDFDMAKSMLRYAFDHGITHFDLANNYGPPPGSAEINFGKIFKSDFKGYRDEMIISSKAGHLMWKGPYGDGSSRKNIMSSLDQSLIRTGLDYFDIFYSHRYDSNTPLEETMETLVDIVRSGKALYVGISKYPPEVAKKAYQYLLERNVRCLIYQDRYNMFTRTVEKESIPLAKNNGCGFIAFSPLAQGLLTDKYVNGLPENSRAATDKDYIRRHHVTQNKIKAIGILNLIAKERGQSMSQMALAWLLNNPDVTSVIVGASSVGQLSSNIHAIDNTEFSDAERERIEKILKETEEADLQVNF
jgi:L-glyceraldehyde 3-phosphate reductase